MVEDVRSRPQLCDTDEQETLRELYDLLISKMKYIGQNNYKSITEDEVRFIFRDLGIYETQ
jgi:hypothetical protein